MLCSKRRLQSQKHTVACSNLGPDPHFEVGDLCSVIIDNLCIITDALLDRPIVLHELHVELINFPVRPPSLSVTLVMISSFAPIVVLKIAFMLSNFELMLATSCASTVVSTMAAIRFASSSEFLRPWSAT